MGDKNLHAAAHASMASLSATLSCGHPHAINPSSPLVRICPHLSQPSLLPSLRTSFIDDPFVTWRNLSQFSVNSVTLCEDCHILLQVNTLQWSCISQMLCSFSIVVKCLLAARSSCHLTMLSGARCLQVVRVCSLTPHLTSELVASSLVLKCSKMWNSDILLFSFPSSGVGKWVPASAGMAKAGMVHSVADERGVCR